MTRYSVFGVYWFVVLSAIGAGGCRPSDPAVYARFETAQQAFDAAATPDEFQRAAALYQEILDTGIVSGAVLYNQGNAFMRAEMRGRALACYRQAKRYRPRDPYLEANLQNARGLAADAEGAKPLFEYLLFWQDWISFPGKFRASLASAMATLVIAAIGVWWKRKGLLRISASMLCIGIAFVVSSTYDWYRFVHIQHGVVVEGAVVARKGNGTSYEPAFNKSLDAATEFTVVERRDDWLLIRLDEDTEKEGWIPLDGAVVY